MLNKVYFKARFITGDKVESFIDDLLGLPSRNA